MRAPYLLDLIFPKVETHILMQNMPIFKCLTVPSSDWEWFLVGVSGGEEDA